MEPLASTIPAKTVLGTGLFENYAAGLTSGEVGTVLGENTVGYVFEEALPQYR
jgi:hypothetical protein